ncbi:MAG: hypothetical protein KDA69_09440 [Planctomycetaceae bacterium]|nr:hypothetical protein [Planctomycetaceae bacterium]MCA9044533.1 hypothetical protein [Planctomycetaceae bacterium]MCB9952700.1 hypothetical protein [Planctomycetaceae bacterium]
MSIPRTELQQPTQLQRIVRLMVDCEQATNVLFSLIGDSAPSASRLSESTTKLVHSMELELSELRVVASRDGVPLIEDRVGRQQLLIRILELAERTSAVHLTIQFMHHAECHIAATVQGESRYDRSGRQVLHIPH